MMTVPDAARVYTRSGLRVIPVPFRGKECFLDGWPGIDLTEADLPRHFPAGAPANLGVKNGPASGGLVDVDLDTSGAVVAADRLLPVTTWVFGRVGRPRSHRWFVTDDPPPTVRLKDLDGTTLVELLSTGTQSVAPPSVHESGERIRWARLAGVPPRIDGAELSRLVHRVGAAELLARHWPNKGSRHDCSLALAGGLLRSGLSEEEAEAFVGLLAELTGDEEGRKRVRNVVSTVKRLEADGKATGWPTLARLLGPDGSPVVDRALAWLGTGGRTEAPAATPPPPEWPAPPGEEAFHGLAGDFVRTLDPATEADPVALLVQLLLGFGSLIGRTAHFVVEADRHYANEFAVLVGKSAKGRKGTSRGRVRAVLAPVDEDWAANRDVSGLSSGEGLIWAVRDPIEKQERVKERGQPVRYETVVADPGVDDKRLMVIEPEFANVLKQTERQGNTLSTVIRQAWETGNLRSLTKNSPARATGAHVSIVGHITTEELRRYLTATETANGFANRFLWFAVDRSKLLPEGGRVSEADLHRLTERLRAAAEFARGVGEVRRNDEAKELWAALYAHLSADRPGVAGALLARAEAHVLRLAMIYALLDRVAVIRADHLAAAAALWDYAERSVLFVFGDATGDPLADDLLRLLRATPQGLRRTDLTRYLSNNVPAARLNAALGLLLRFHLARPEMRETGGRDAEWWFAGGRGKG